MRKQVTKGFLWSFLSTVWVFYYPLLAFLFIFARFSLLRSVWGTVSQWCHGTDKTLFSRQNGEDTVLYFVVEVGSLHEASVWGDLGDTHPAAYTRLRGVSVAHPFCFPRFFLSPSCALVWWVGSATGGESFQYWRKPLRFSSETPRHWKKLVWISNENWKPEKPNWVHYLVTSLSSSASLDAAAIFIFWDKGVCLKQSYLSSFPGLYLQIHHQCGFVFISRTLPQSIFVSSGRGAHEDRTVCWRGSKDSREFSVRSYKFAAQEINSIISHLYIT